MIEDQSTIWQIAYISEPRIIVELLLQKKNKNYYTNTTKAISYTVSKDKQTSCQDCHFLTFNKSRSPTFPPESWYCSLSCVVFCSNQLLIVGFESSSCRLPKSPSCWPTNKYTSSKVPEVWLNQEIAEHYQTSSFPRSGASSEYERITAQDSHSTNIGAKGPSCTSVETARSSGARKCNK